MPSVAQVPEEGVAGKKRRWEDSGEVVRVCSPNVKHTSRSESTPHPYNSNHTSHAHASLIEEKQLQHQEYRERERRILPIPSLKESCKRQRTSPSTAHSPLSPSRERIEGRTEAARGEVTPVKKTDLSPCHICHRKPTLKAELDSFADCEGCRKRTCWICIRECLGSAVGVGRDVEMGGHDSHGGDGEGEGGRDGDVERGRDCGREGDTGHKGMVCSRCCVERGTEGEVWCFGCLRNEGGG